MNDLRTAVIGIGNMGMAHASCIARGEIEGLKLVAVCDINREKADEFCNSHRGIRAFYDYKTLIDSNAADCVIIAVPHPLHAQIAKCALNMQVHVMVEKPVDVSVTKAMQLNEAAEKSNAVFGIMFNQRTNPIFKTAREIVRSGKLGELKRATWIVTNWYRTQSYYNSGGWRATWSGEGGGVLLNQAPHNLDIFQWICGMPESVTAFCDIGKYHEIEVEDDATLFFKYGNGATGTFIVSTGEFPGTNRIEISGTLGKLVLENAELKWWKLYENERDICQHSSESFAEIPFEYTVKKVTETESGHQIILKNFADAIRSGEKLIAPGTEGINELTLSNAAYLSQWSGNTEIKIPIDSERFDRELKTRCAASKFENNAAESEHLTDYRERWHVRW